MQQRTMCIIKPDGTKRNLIGNILERFEESGLKVSAMKMRWLSPLEAERFYEVHRGKIFFEPLIKFMCSGPVVLFVLEGDNAISKARNIMGTTDPAEAKAGTIRKDFAINTRENTVHGSDSPESAQKEIGFFFSESEIFKLPST